MKDLKHMIYFEKLLDSACNDLVREAQKENRVAVGYTCFHIPEVLLNLDHCFSVRLRAPYMGSTEIATYYLASSACEFSRALLERAIEGGFQFLDAIAGVDICECMNRCYENMELLEIQGKEKKNFFISYVDVPGKDEEITCLIRRRRLRASFSFGKNVERRQISSAAYPSSAGYLPSFNVLPIMER